MAASEGARRRKAKNLSTNINFLNSINADYEPHNKGTQLNFTLQNGEVVAFYPTTNKWVHNGKVFFGGAKKLWDWIGQIEEE